jgi:retron-type reverse transcriptase
MDQRAMTDLIAQTVPRRPLPVTALADLLEVSPADLRALAEDVERQYQCYYPVSPRASQNGRRKRRWIEAPRPALKAVQRRILDRLAYQLPPTPYAHGFVPGRSILTHARNHCGRAWVLAMDIVDFFPSVSNERVAAIASELPLLPADRRLFVRLVTRREHLPQGAPTSPHLANLVTRSMDHALADLARRSGWAYSRYADDLALSGDTDPQPLRLHVERIVERFGFRIARRKTKLMPASRRQRVTGLVVNDRVTVPRPLRRRLRAILHRVRLDGWESVDAEGPHEVLGHLAFVSFIMPELAPALAEALRRLCEDDP